MNKKFSFSAVVLTVLLFMRIIMKLFVFIKSLFQPNMFTFVFLILVLVYLTAFIGIIMKTKWALLVTLIMGIIDLVASFLFMNSSNYIAMIGALIYNIILIIFSIIILKRIKN